MPPLIDDLQISPEYAIAAVYYAPGDVVRTEVMALQLDHWVMLKSRHAAHLSLSGDVSVAVASVVGAVCETSCPPCEDLPPAAVSRINELMDIKEAQSFEINATRASLRGWRYATLGVGIAFFVAAGYIASRD